MKEKKIKTFATLLLALIVGVCGTGCAKTVDGGIELDPNKETILVQVHGGGRYSKPLFRQQNQAFARKGGIVKIHAQFRTAFKVYRASGNLQNAVPRKAGPREKGHRASQFYRRVFEHEIAVDQKAAL